MNNTTLSLCYNTTLTYILNKYERNKLFSKFNVSYEDLAIAITASLFKKNSDGSIMINLKEKDNNEGDFLFLIINAVKEKVDRAIKFEMLKYDLISIEEYSSQEL
jgi:hypothetical protein